MRSVGWHYQHGCWRVRYPDGYVSQPFSWATACTYRDLFGGTIERVPGREPFVWLRRILLGTKGAP